ncbi:hypothetical protein BaRGS_00023144, partial [Batillaria attramentaria]
MLDNSNFRKAVCIFQAPPLSPPSTTLPPPPSLSSAASTDGKWQMANGLRHIPLGSLLFPAGTMRLSLCHRGRLAERIDGLSISFFLTCREG